MWGQLLAKELMNEHYQNLQNGRPILHSHFAIQILNWFRNFAANKNQ